MRPKLFERGDEAIHVLGAVHGHIDLAINQRAFDFFGEQSLSAKIRQPPILDPITGRFDDFELRRILACLAWVDLGYHARDGARLRQCERAAPCADAEWLSLSDHATCVNKCRSETRLSSPLSDGLYGMRL